MVEADSHLKLLPSFILNIYKEFEHIDMLSIGIQQQPYRVLRTLLGTKLRDSESLVESKRCHYVMVHTSSNQ